MQVKVRFLDNLRLEASFDDFTVVADQPIRYKGDGTAPGPFDYFLASSALCAAYFVKAYCKARDIPTEDISITQDNIVDPQNRYQQVFKISAELPDTISEKDKKGIISSMDRCSVKRVIQNSPDFQIETIGAKEKSAGLLYKSDSTKKTMIVGKDCSLEETIANMTAKIEALGIKIEIASWRNIVPHIWSVHVRDADSPMCFSNGKGATKDAALCSALGEYLERLSTHYFYNDFFLGEEISGRDFVHYKNEKWFGPKDDDSLPEGLMDKTFLEVFNKDNELKGSHLIDTNSGRSDRGICALPYERQSDKETVYIPVNLIGNIFVSNGMSAGNTIDEARVQALSEIFERAIKKKIILEEITLPNIPQSTLKKFPTIVEGIKKLEEQGLPILVKDASLGGKYPVICVTLINPRTGGVFASFGAHPKFEVALERTLTELMQGRSFEGMNDVLAPTFNQDAVNQDNNIVDHFIDSNGVLSWVFFSDSADYQFTEWNFSGETKDEYNYLMDILKEMNKEVYIASYEELGVKACRILVPNYSEIYGPEDLIWDNHNKSINFRKEVLCIHSLTSDETEGLYNKIEDEQLDDQMLISDLIGVAFDDSSPWGQCTVGELKILICLALGNHEEAKDLTELFLAFNDCSRERKQFYQVLNILLDIELREDLQLKNYQANLEKMYQEDIIRNASKSISGEVLYYGLTQTDMNLKGINKHLKLIESYKKLSIS